MREYPSDSRIPKLSDFDSDLELPPTVYQDLQIEEESRLFVVNSSLFDKVVREIAEQNVSVHNQYLCE